MELMCQGLISRNTVTKSNKEKNERRIFFSYTVFAKWERGVEIAGLRNITKTPVIEIKEGIHSCFSYQTAKAIRSFLWKW